MRFRILDTPTGPFALCEEPNGALRTMWITLETDDALTGGRRDPALREDLFRRLEAYFGGHATDFSDVPTPANMSASRSTRSDGTFFVRCWEACRTIPRGETRTYAELSVMAGGIAGAARAAGGAMRNNPLPIIVPCHRVVGAGDRLGGFSGNDDPRGRTVSIKRRLLEMEGALSAPVAEPLLFETSISATLSSAPGSSPSPAATPVDPPAQGKTLPCD